MSKENNLKQRCFQARLLELSSEITKERIDTLRREVLELACESAEEITILIDTNGGAAAPALWGADFLRAASRSVPITGIVNGRCRSMGVSILQACSYRISLPSSSFCPHLIRRKVDYPSESAEKERIQREQTDNLNEQMHRLLSARSGNPQNFVRELCEYGTRTGRDYTADEFMEMRFLDAVEEFPAQLTLEKLGKTE